MKAVVCIEPNLGIAFNHRRVSLDIKQREDLFQLIQDDLLYMKPSTAKLYGEHPQFVITEDTISKCQDHFCIFENDEINDCEDKIEILVLYNWNRKYPSDQKLQIDLSKYRLKEQIEFGGKSHEKITRTIYVKKD